MDEKLNKLFIEVSGRILTLIKEKQVDIDILAFNLGIDRKTFVNNFCTRINDFTFYLQTLSLLENWEG